MNGHPVRGAEAAKREQILDAAAGLFGGLDLANVTMDEVASRAGVAKGTLYNYFRSKDELYVAILKVRLGHLLDALAQSFAGEEEVQVRLRKFLVHTWNFFVKYPDFFRMVRKEEVRPAGHASEEVLQQRETLRDLLRSVLTRGMEEGTLRTLPPELATDLILGALEGTVLRALRQGATPQRNTGEPEVLFDFVWSSLSRSGDDPPGPLTGIGVLVTREELPGEGLSHEIELLGGRAVHLPLLAYAPPADMAALDGAVLRMRDYAWVLFTSARAVRVVAERLRSLMADPLPASCRIGAVGRGTREAVVTCHGRCDLEAGESNGAGLARALIDRETPVGKRVLLPRAEDATPEIVRLLREAGAVLDEVVAYRTIPAMVDPGPVRSGIEAGAIRVVTFSSPSAVRAFLDRIGPEYLSPTCARRPAIAVLGRTTAEELRLHGLPVDAVAMETSFKALALASAQSMAARRKENPDELSGGTTPASAENRVAPAYGP